jgi:hypothetical protein
MEVAGAVDDRMTHVVSVVELGLDHHRRRLIRASQRRHRARLDHIDNDRTGGSWAGRAMDMDPVVAEALDAVHPPTASLLIGPERPTTL